MSLSTWFASFVPTAAEVRTEVWRLGVRHQGEPLEGALSELRTHGLAPARTALLKACVRALKRAP